MNVMNLGGGNSAQGRKFKEKERKEKKGEEKRRKNVIKEEET